MFIEINYCHNKCFDTYKLPDFMSKTLMDYHMIYNLQNKGLYSPHMSESKFHLIFNFKEFFIISYTPIILETFNYYKIHHHNQQHNRFVL